MRISKLSPKPAKLLKALHLFFISMWIGGLLTWVPLTYGLQLDDYAITYNTYLNLRSIAWNVIGWGGIGSFVTGVLNGILTHWGLFRHRWVVAKLFATIAMVLFGMFFTEQKMLNNLELLDNGDTAILHDTAFVANHNAIKLVAPLQLLIFLLIIIFSLYKPWMKNKTSKTG